MYFFPSWFATEKDHAPQRIDTRQFAWQRRNRPAQLDAGCRNLPDSRRF
jgi:hypothetical protein